MGITDLVIAVPAPPEAAELKFPEIFCKEIGLFDNLVGQMREGSEQGLKPNQIESTFIRIIEQYYKRDISREERGAVKEMVSTYVVFDDLRRQGRDSVWTYVARNLSRPLALAFGTGWANVVIGNPPWVAFRHMSSDLQKRFRELAKAERVYVGGKFATQNDLAALFSVRAAHLYLRSGGRIAFVLPLAALTRGQFDLLRKGSFTSAKIAWEEAWTMDDGVQPLFPVPSCVVFGRRRATPQAVPDIVRAFEGTLPLRDASEEVANARLVVRDDAPRPSEGQFTGGSAYRSAFRQGATLVPRMLCFVERQTAGRLGGDPTAPFVKSRRSPQEKQPWKLLAGIEHRVEAEFLLPVLLGESILPYRIFRPFEAVVPVTPEGAILDAQAAANRGLSGLHGYMSAAEAIWNKHSESDGMTLVQRWNYHNELGSQFPQSPIRVIYAASGTIPVACLLRDSRSIIEHGIYWAPVSTDEEGYFLIAVFNSETARSRVADLQARGQWGARHFDKVVFTLPIPRFDCSNRLHAEIVEASRNAEGAAALVELPDNAKFQSARKRVRAALRTAGITDRIEALVSELLED